mmetsp:Transcript_12836/g.19872  ORF Transcript_12836/g.19872 Transcript_12836/m.19872 type:complete len:228 (+) Transcript_12836:113-796(+)
MRAMPLLWSRQRNLLEFSGLIVPQVGRAKLMLLLIIFAWKLPMLCHASIQTFVLLDKERSQTVDIELQASLGLQLRRVQIWKTTTLGLVFLLRMPVQGTIGCTPRLQSGARLEKATKKLLGMWLAAMKLFHLQSSPHQIQLSNPHHNRQTRQNRHPARHQSLWIISSLQSNSSILFGLIAVRDGLAKLTPQRCNFVVPNLVSCALHLPFVLNSLRQKIFRLVVSRKA